VADVADVVASVVRPMQKKRNNSQANPSEFAYVRIALELALEISFDAINELAFSISRHIRIEHNVRYSVVLIFFALDLRAKLLFLVILTLFLIITHQKHLHYIF